VAAAALIAAVVVLAGPERLWRLLAGADPRWLAAAAFAAAADYLLLGVRLVLLTADRRLGVVRASAVAAAARAAALFLPMRTGEAVLPLLLRRVGAQPLSAGVAVLVVARTLDVANIVAWGAAGLLVVGGAGVPAAAAAAVTLLVAPVLVLPRVAAIADALAVRLLAGRGRGWRRWAHRVRRVHRSVDGIHRRPRLLLLSGIVSLAHWSLVWGAAWILLRAVSFEWPIAEVVLGSAIASVSAALPINLLANLGSVEAGWTAAFVALGRTVEDAAASGLAIHLLALCLSFAYGVAGWLVIGATATRVQGER
jgi:uncharacterized membrane protein YbhN (UPF0104 family)